MEETTGLSKQQKKSMETKAKIFKAAKRILQRSGYETLSIKNICEEAGVSNGSFYHHFKTKGWSFVLLYRRSAEHQRIFWICRKMQRMQKERSSGIF